MLEFTHVDSNEAFIHVLAMDIVRQCYKKETSEASDDPGFPPLYRHLLLASSVLPTPEDPQNKKTKG